MIILFACRRYRLRDIGLLRRGVVAAGHRLWVMELPFAVPVLLVAAIMRLFGLRMHLVISDKQIGDTFLARLFGRHSTRMLWNYADEWPSVGTRVPKQRVCFFREAGADADLFVFAPQPIRSYQSSRSRSVVFVGDVTLDVKLPRGSQWWQQRFGELARVHGYTFYLRPEYELLIRENLDGGTDRRAARVLAKNLLRLWIVQAARAKFGDKIVLLGSNWSRFSLDSAPSIYTEAGRLEYFRSAVVNLDCASKSGNSALYPRSSELISFAGGLLQVRCADADIVYGERVDEFCFHDERTLIARLDERLKESPEVRAERDAWLIERLRNRHLLMQHSINRMLNRAPC